MISNRVIIYENKPGWFIYTNQNEDIHFYICFL